MQIRIDFQAENLLGALNAIQQAIATPDTLLLAIANRLVNRNRERHQQQVAPDGTPWTPLSPLTRLSKKNNWILNESGSMMRDFGYQPPEGNTIRIGFSQAKLPPYHHFGTGKYGPKGTPYVIKPKKGKGLKFMTPSGETVRKQVIHPGIPARPLLGFPAEDEQLTGDVVREYLERILSKYR
jgi:phage gpG-like protein